MPKILHFTYRHSEPRTFALYEIMRSFSNVGQQCMAKFRLPYQ